MEWWTRSWPQGLALLTLDIDVSVEAHDLPVRDIDVDIDIVAAVIGDHQRRGVTSTDAIADELAIRRVLAPGQSVARIGAFVVRIAQYRGGGWVVPGVG